MVVPVLAEDLVLAISIQLCFGNHGGLLRQRDDLSSDEIAFPDLCLRVHVDRLVLEVRVVAVILGKRHGFSTVGHANVLVGEFVEYEYNFHRLSPVAISAGSDGTPATGLDKGCGSVIGPPGAAVACATHIAVAIQDDDVIVIVKSAVGMNGQRPVQRSCCIRRVPCGSHIDVYRPWRIG